MKRTVLFFVFTLTAFCYSVQANLRIDQLLGWMTENELTACGLDKLTPEQKRAFDHWIDTKCPQYYVSLTRKVEAQDLAWCLGTVPFASNIGPDTTPDTLDDQPMDWRLSLCAIFQDEALYLKEWIEFYKLMGVEHFYLYNNQSRDNYYEVLEPYIRSGELELFEWPITSFGRNQCYCYSHAIRLAKGKTRWLIIADTDEFMFPLQHETITDFLKEYEHPWAGGVVVSWRCYGTSHLSCLPPGGLLTELLTFRSEDHSELVKSIVKPHRVQDMINPHWALYKPGFYAYDENWNHIVHHCNPRSPASRIRCNHYYTRDEHFFYNIKTPRGLKGNRSINRLDESDLIVTEEMLDGHRAFDATLNKVEDLSIYRFLPGLKQRMKCDSKKEKSSQ